MQYSSVLKQGQLLAIADEDGYVSIVDTQDGLPSQLQVSEGEDSKVKAQWLAHRNSIYQVAWTKARLLRCEVAIHAPAHHGHTSRSARLQPAMPWNLSSSPCSRDARGLQGDANVLTASADFTIKQWDTLSAANTSCLVGHSGSVKSMSVHPTCQDVVASGGRDTAVLLWDMRTRGLPTASVKAIGAHVRIDVRSWPNACAVQSGGSRMSS